MNPERVKALRDWVVSRAQETSTWGGILSGVSTILGVAIDPAHTQVYLGIGTTVGSVLAILTKEG